MKKLIVMMMLAVIMVGCNNKSSTPVEERFEQYINAENLKEVFVKVDSIILLDSVNLNSHYNELISYNDSIKAILFQELEPVSNGFGGAVRAQKDAIEAVNLILRLSKVTDKEVEVAIKEKISIFLEDIPETKSWYKTYKIVANFNDGKRFYYAHNFAFEDTITISTEVYGGMTHKAERITNYFVDYMSKVSAPKSVLLDDVRAFSAKFN